MDIDINSKKETFSDSTKNLDAIQSNKTDINQTNDIWNDSSPINTGIGKLFDELFNEVNTFNFNTNNTNTKNKKTYKTDNDIKFEEILKKYDLDHDGKIDTNEIYATWIDVNEAEVILSDTNPANIELKKLFSGFLRRDGSFDTEKFIKRAGSDGKLNLSELSSTAIEGRSEDYADMKVNTMDKTKNTFYDAIKKFDANNDNKLDAEELEAIYLNGDPNNKEIKRLFRAFMNTDGTANKEQITKITGADGKIGIEEILRYADRAQNLF